MQEDAVSCSASRGEGVPAYRKNLTHDRSCTLALFHAFPAPRLPANTNTRGALVARCQLATTTQGAVLSGGEPLCNPGTRRAQRHWCRQSESTSTDKPTPSLNTRSAPTRCPGSVTNANLSLQLHWPLVVTMLLNATSTIPHGVSFCLVLSLGVLRDRTTGVGLGTQEMRSCNPIPRLESPRSCEGWSAGVQGQIWIIDGSGQTDAEMQDKILRTLRPWIDIDRPLAQHHLDCRLSCISKSANPLRRQLSLKLQSRR